MMIAVLFMALNVGLNHGVFDDKSAWRPFQGKWIVDSHARGGEYLTDGYSLFPTETKCSVKNDQLTVEYGFFKIRSTITIDPSTRPKQINFHLSDGGVLKGIYANDEDILVLAVSVDLPSVRPTRFRAAGKSTSVIILRRIHD